MKNIIYLFLLFSTFSFGQVVPYVMSAQSESLITSTCADGIQNGNETGIDCGGDCTDCDTYVEEADICVSCTNREQDLVLDESLEFFATSASDLTDVANSGKIAVITSSSSFSLQDMTLAPNLILKPRGGTITGTNINLNGALIVLNTSSIFDPSARFTTQYASCLSPETFGSHLASDDTPAIEAMLLNGTQGVSDPGSIYTMDSPIDNITRYEFFQWNGNNSVIDSNFESTTSGDTYLFDFDNFKFELCDLEIDGNGVLDNIFSIGNNGVRMQDISMHNLRSDNDSERVVAVKYDLYSSNTDEVLFDNVNIYDLGAFSNGIANDGDGVTRSIWILYRETLTPLTMRIINSDFYNTYGDDSDPIHTFEVNDDFDHDVTLIIENCNFWGNARRDIKAHMSNVKIRYCTFTIIDPSLTTTPTAGISFGLTGDTATENMAVKNIELSNCTFYNPWPNDSSNSYINTNFASIADCEGARIFNNRFENLYMGNSGGLNIQGRQNDNLVYNNEFINSGLMLIYNADGGGYAEVYNNTFDTVLDYSLQAAVIRNLALPSASAYLKFYQNTVDITYNVSAGNFYGLYGAQHSGQTHTEVHIYDNVITLSGSNKSGQSLAEIGGDFGATNSLENNIFNGADSTNPWIVDGAETFINTNNVNENAVAITIQ